MIDWNRVHELKDEIGEDDFGEVIEIFLEEVDEIIERFRDSAGSIDHEADLHCLKGSALNLGFTTFADLCSRGEEAAKSGQAQTIDLSAIVACYLSSRTAFADPP